MSAQASTEGKIGLKKIGSGKVRELYDAGPDLLLLVATDRISAFDVVFNEEIPDKGRVLTGLSLFWFGQIDSITKTHLITTDPARFPVEVSADMAGRAMLVQKAEMLPVEFVIRGYLYGSAWQEYKSSGTIGGEPAPEGLEMASPLEAPLLTPTTKAAPGEKDMPLSRSDAAKLCPGDYYERAEAATLAVFKRAQEVASERGFLLADTKFEFGVAGGELLLADEVLTPDSSRFWPAVDYEPGRDQQSFDKQYVREYLSSTAWDRQPPPPQLPPDVIEGTRRRYIEAYNRLTGEDFADYLQRFGVSPTAI